MLPLDIYSSSMILLSSDNVFAVTIRFIIVAPCVFVVVEREKCLGNARSARVIGGSGENPFGVLLHPVMYIEDSKMLHSPCRSKYQPQASNGQSPLLRGESKLQSISLGSGSVLCRIVRESLGTGSESPSDVGWLSREFWSDSLIFWQCGRVSL